MDSLGYLSLENAMRLAGDEARGFCTACFGGGYPTQIPKSREKDKFQQKIHAPKSL